MHGLFPRKLTLGSCANVSIPSERSLSRDQTVRGQRRNTAAPLMEQSSFPEDVPVRYLHSICREKNCRVSNLLNVLPPNTNSSYPKGWGARRLPTLAAGSIPVHCCTCLSSFFNSADFCFSSCSCSFAFSVAAFASCRAMESSAIDTVALWRSSHRT